MAFMEKESFAGTYYAVETVEGTWFLPDGVCGNLEGMEPGILYSCPENDEPDACWDAWCSLIRNYVPLGIRQIERREGTLYRLSAPGYLDCTDWTTDPDSPEFDDPDE